jgi:hypothetical protein
MGSIASRADIDADVGEAYQIPSHITKSRYFHLFGDDLDKFNHEKFFRFSWEDICAKTIPFGNLPVDKNSHLNTKKAPPLQAVNAWADIQQGLFKSKQHQYYPPILYTEYCLMFQWMYKQGFIEGDESQWIYFLQGSNEIAKDLDRVAIVFATFLKLGWAYSRINKKLNRNDYDYLDEVQWQLKDDIPILHGPVELAEHYLTIAKKYLVPYKEYRMPDPIIDFIWHEEQRNMEATFQMLANQNTNVYPVYSVAFTHFIQEYHPLAYEHFLFLQSVYKELDKIAEKNIVTYWQTQFIGHLFNMAGADLTTKLEDFRNKVYHLSGKENAKSTFTPMIALDSSFQNEDMCYPEKQWFPPPDGNTLKLMLEYEEFFKNPSLVAVKDKDIANFYAFLNNIKIADKVTFVPLDMLAKALRNEIHFNQHKERIQNLYNTFFFYFRQIKQISDDFKKPIELWTWNQYGQTYFDREMEKGRETHKVDQKVLDTFYPEPWNIKDKAYFMKYIEYRARMPDFRDKAPFESLNEYKRKTTVSGEDYRIWREKMWELRAGLKDHPIGSKWEDKNGVTHYNWYMDYGVWDELQEDHSVWAAILYVGSSPYKALFGTTLEDEVIAKGRKAMHLLFEQLSTASDLLGGFLKEAWLPIVAIGGVAVAGLYVYKNSGTK